MPAPESTGASPDHAGVAFHPPFLLAGAIAVGYTARWLFALSFLPSSLSGIGGPVVSAAAFALFLWAVATMRRGGGSIPTHLPTDSIVVLGPYRHTRNPIYLAMVTLQMGLGVWANSLWFFGLAGLSVILLQWGVIVREERYLERKFGEDYLAYKRSVRRWL